MISISPVHLYQSWLVCYRSMGYKDGSFWWKAARFGWSNRLWTPLPGWSGSCRWEAPSWWAGRLDGIRIASAQILSKKQIMLLGIYTVQSIWIFILDIDSLQMSHQQAMRVGKLVDTCRCLVPCLNNAHIVWALLLVTILSVICTL